MRMRMFERFEKFERHISMRQTHKDKQCQERASDWPRSGEAAVIELEPRMAGQAIGGSVASKVTDGY